MEGDSHSHKEGQQNELNKQTRYDDSFSYLRSFGIVDETGGSSLYVEGDEVADDEEFREEPDR